MAEMCSFAAELLLAGLHVRWSSFELVVCKTSEMAFCLIVGATLSLLSSRPGLFLAKNASGVAVHGTAFVRKSWADTDGGGVGEIPGLRTPVITAGSKVHTDG